MGKTKEYMRDGVARDLEAMGANNINRAYFDGRRIVETAKSYKII